MSIDREPVLTTTSYSITDGNNSEHSLSARMILNLDIPYFMLHVVFSITCYHQTIFILQRIPLAFYTYTRCISGHILSTVPMHIIQRTLIC